MFTTTSAIWPSLSPRWPKPIKTAFQTSQPWITFVTSTAMMNGGRMAQKKLPGKGWEYMVYNTMDQVVATQDSLQREQNQWVFTKYDALGRVIMTGIHDDTATDTTRAGLQSVIDTLSVLWETPTGTARGYTSVAWPAEPDEVMTVNYYDTYNSYFTTNLHFRAPGNANLQPTRLLTATQTEVLGDGNMLSSVFYYDDLGRNLVTYKQHYLGNNSAAQNYDQVSNAYDFTNAITQSTRRHYTLQLPPARLQP